MTAVGETLVREDVHRIAGTPAEVFPLLCPVREDDWLDGWADVCTMVQSASGIAELGCVFLTRDPGLSDVTWVCSRYEPDELVEYIRVRPGVEVVTLTITVRSEDAGSRVDIRHTVVGLPGADETALVQRWGADRDPGMLWWERAMNHYVTTGELLRHGVDA